MFRVQNIVRAALVVAGLALVSIPAAAQAGGGCHVKFHGCHSFNHCHQPIYCQPSYCQPSYCQPVVNCYPYACQPIIVQPYCKPICQPYFPHCKPVIIHKW